MPKLSLLSVVLLCVPSFVSRHILGLSCSPTNVVNYQSRHVFTCRSLVGLRLFD